MQNTFPTFPSLIWCCEQTSGHIDSLNVSYCLLRNRGHGVEIARHFSPFQASSNAQLNLGIKINMPKIEIIVFFIHTFLFVLLSLFSPSGPDCQLNQAKP